MERIAGQSLLSLLILLRLGWQRSVSSTIIDTETGCEIDFCLPRVVTWV